MAALAAKVVDRIRDGLKTFQPILGSAKARDVNESDTVLMVTDLLQHLFGYDKYSEITSEHMIRGTYCDLAVKLEGKLAFLLEVKAIGIELKDQHVNKPSTTPLIRGSSGSVLQTASFGVCTKLALQNRSQTSSWSSSISCS